MEEKVYHFEGAPLDYFENYIPLKYLSEKLDKLNWKKMTITYSEVYRLIIRLIQEGLLIVCKNGGIIFRENNIWIYYETGEVGSDINADTYITDICVIMKEENNGTCHLFSFNSFKNDYPHDFEEGPCWERCK